MPLETTIQSFSIVQRRSDFSNPAKIYDSNSYKTYIFLGKWIEVVPTQLLNTTRKLFIDVSNNIYNIENINQAIRLFIRPISIAEFDSNYGNVFNCNVSGGNNYLIGSREQVTRDFVSKANMTFYSYYQDTSSFNMVIADYDNLRDNFKTALGEIPDLAKTTTFYLDGKFLGNQPHIEHINSGNETIYNNLRVISLIGGETGAYRILDIDYEALTNGFILNSFYSNPTMESGLVWNWDYALYDLKIKYIYDILDLPTNYLSYGIPYKRYFVLAKSGNPSVSRDKQNVYHTYSKYSYSAFEFFLAPVGEAS